MTGVLVGMSLAQSPTPSSSIQVSPTVSQPPAQNVEQLKARAERAERKLADWGQLARYAETNSKLAPPAKGEKRVIFYGDSITDVWRLDDSFPGKGYLNRGVDGQTTSQMLVRFRADVIKLRPKVVVILAGTNDIAGNTGPMTLEQIEDNYATLAELARIHKIQVIFCSVTPVHNYTARARERLVRRPPEKILELNRWLKDHATQYQYIYLDYLSGMVDKEGLLRVELAEDGLHPNAEGYAVMAKVVGPVITKVVGRSR